MGQHVYLYRTETRLQNNGPEFLGNPSLCVEFSPEQRQKLHDRLLRYNFTFEAADGEYVLQADGFSVQARIYPTYVDFSTYAGTWEAVFEIQMTASEFTDSPDFAKFDPDTLEWEVLEE